MKKVLSESEFKKFITEAVDKALNEISISQKKRNIKDVENAFRTGKKGFSAIKTIAVFTAENPNSQEMPSVFNKKANHSLKDELKSAQYKIIPCVGKFYDNPEHPYAVVNIYRSSVSAYCGKYEQTSFVYSEFKDGAVHSEYWEKNDPSKPYNKHNNPYVLKDSSDTWLDRELEDDGYTIVGNKFKYQIPFSIFNEANQHIIDNITKYLIQEGRVVNEENIDNEIKFGYEGIGYPAYRRRYVANYDSPK